jgi:adenylylsulfate kinase
MLLGQRATVAWLTGLSGAGKSTLARAVERALHDAGRYCVVLDGDEIRCGLNRGLGFTDEDRAENIRRIAEVARILVDAGAIVIVAVISPGRAMRQSAREIVGGGDFMEVYVRCPLEVCRERDVKGLYAQADAGRVGQLTGVSAPYEAPESPALVLDTSKTTVEESARVLLAELHRRIGVE